MQKTINVGNTDDLVLTKYVNADGPYIIGRNASGSSSSPVATADGSWLLYLGGRGYNGSAFTSASSSSIRFEATQAWTPSATGSAIVFGTTADNSSLRVDRMIINSNGNVGVGTITPSAKLDVQGDVRFAPTTLAPTVNSTLDPLVRNNMSYISINAAAGVTTTISSISAPSNPATAIGTMLYISIGSGTSVILKNNASAVPANTIYTYNGSDYSVSGRGGLILVYDVDGWRMIGGAG